MRITSKTPTAPSGIPSYNSPVRDGSKHVQSRIDHCNKNIESRIDNSIDHNNLQLPMDFNKILSQKIEEVEKNYEKKFTEMKSNWFTERSNLLENIDFSNTRNKALVEKLNNNYEAQDNSSRSTSPILRMRTAPVSSNISDIDKFCSVDGDHDKFNGLLTRGSEWSVQLDNSIYNR
jgi:hypothetical protein